MNFTPVPIAALVVLTAAGLVTRGWFAMAQVEENLRSISGFEDMDFEV